MLLINILDTETLDVEVPSIDNRGHPPESHTEAIHRGGAIVSKQIEAMATSRTMVMVIDTITISIKRIEAMAIKGIITVVTVVTEMPPATVVQGEVRGMSMQAAKKKI